MPGGWMDEGPNVAQGPSPPLEPINPYTCIGNADVMLPSMATDDDHLQLVTVHLLPQADEIGYQPPITQGKYHQCSDWDTLRCTEGLAALIGNPDARRGIIRHKHQPTTWTRKHVKPKESPAVDVRNPILCTACATATSPPPENRAIELKISWFPDPHAHPSPVVTSKVFIPPAQETIIHRELTPLSIDEAPDPPYVSTFQLGSSTGPEDLGSAFVVAAEDELHDRNGSPSRPPVTGPKLSLRGGASSYENIGRMKENNGLSTEPLQCLTNHCKTEASHGQTQFRYKPWKKMVRVKRDQRPIQPVGLTDKAQNHGSNSGSVHVPVQESQVGQVNGHRRRRSSSVKLNSLPRTMDDFVLSLHDEYDSRHGIFGVLGSLSQILQEWPNLEDRILNQVSEIALQEQGVRFAGLDVHGQQEHQVSPSVSLDGHSDFLPTRRNSYNTTEPQDRGSPIPQGMTSNSIRLISDNDSPIEDLANCSTNTDHPTGSTYVVREQAHDASLGDLLVKTPPIQDKSPQKDRTHSEGDLSVQWDPNDGWEDIFNLACDPFIHPEELFSAFDFVAGMDSAASEPAPSPSRSQVASTDRVNSVSPVQPPASRSECCSTASSQLLGSIVITINAGIPAASNLEVTIRPLTRAQSTSFDA